MSDPKDDGQLEVVADSDCPHCVIMQMAAALIGDGTYSAVAMARYTHTALADLLAQVEPGLRDVLMHK